MAGIDIERPRSKGFATADASEIQRYQRCWKVGTTERLIFDLAPLTGAARADLVRLSRRDIEGELLTYHRQKTGVAAEIAMTPESREVIARTTDIAPAFILTSRGKPFIPEGLGKRFRDAAEEAGITARLHGLRKAFCVYWAERKSTTHQIAAMAGHISLKEVELYTKAADRKRMVRLLVKGS